jgi:poly(3-hydroxybutyrate) depolymerase
MRTKLVSIAITFATVAMTGCGGDECSGSEFSGTAPTCGASGTFERSVCVEGKLRKFREYVPPTLVCDTPPPLVLFLHGNGGDEASGDAAHALADELGFVFVALRGIDQGDYLGFGPEGIPNSRELTVRVVDQVRREFPTDPSSTLLTGFSGGAFFASYCIAWLNDRLAGVGVFGAGMAEEWFDELSTSPVKIPVLIRVGDQDSLKLYAHSLLVQLQASGWPRERVDYKIFEGGHTWNPEMIRETFNWSKAF